MEYDDDLQLRLSSIYIDHGEWPPGAGRGRVPPLLPPAPPEAGPQRALWKGLPQVQGWATMIFFKLSSFVNKILFSLYKLLLCCCRGRFPSLQREFSTVLLDDPAAHHDHYGCKPEFEPGTAATEVWCATNQSPPTSPRHLYKIKDFLSPTY